MDRVFSFCSASTNLTGDRAHEGRVIGTGHVGLITAATLASLVHEVSAVDSDAERIDMLRRGEPPFFEPAFPGS